ncbi:MAG TPA: hypothetical protein VGK06_12310 [Methanosarcina sp.]
MIDLKNVPRSAQSLIFRKRASSLENVTSFSIEHWYLQTDLQKGCR